MPLLEIEHLVKEYGGHVRANDDISISVEAGEVYGLLGPNGAGKTTLVNQLIGLLGPTPGTILVDGHDVVRDPGFARRLSSFLPQQDIPIDGLTPRQAIELIGRMRGGQKKDVRRRGAELIAALEIGDWADIQGQRLSGGVRQLVAFVMAAVTPGRIVILDEPTNDVDPLRRRLLWRQVTALAERGSAVLLVTHNVLEAERAVNRLAVLDHGRVIGQGTPATIKGDSANLLRIEVTFEPSAEQPEPPPFLTRAVHGGRRTLGLVESAEVGVAVRWAQGLQAQGIVEEFSIGPTSLEEAYVQMVGRPDALELGAEPAAASGGGAIWWWRTGSAATACSFTGRR